jgi:hypothetical protein
VVVTTSTANRAALIERYRLGYDAVVEALAGVTSEELDSRPASGGWTAREIVHHLADSEMTSAMRLRKLLIEDQPLLQGYDEEAFARGLKYAEREIEPALDALAAARRTTAQILERMTDSDWQRSGTHSESGPYSATDWLQIYAAHAHDHAAQIDECLRLARAGKVA